MSSSISSPIIECRNVSHGFRRGREQLQVLKSLNMRVDRGAFVAIMGPSGSGKSTLLNLLGGLDQPDSGEIIVEGLSLAQLTRKTLSQWRASNVGFVFQFYNLLPVLTALRNVELPLLLTPLSSAQRLQKSKAALELVGLQDRATHRPSELSGGQQQRVAIARALVTDAPVLICDEPTGDLDRESANEILQLLQTLNTEFGKTIIMVTHDPKAAERAGMVWQMDKGHLATEPGSAAA